jgi:hypothetical protein
MLGGRGGEESRGLGITACGGPHQTLARLCFLSFRETYHEPIQRDVWLRGIAGLAMPDCFSYLRLLVKLDSLAEAIC